MRYIQKLNALLCIDKIIASDTKHLDLLKELRNSINSCAEDNVAPTIDNFFKKQKLSFRMIGRSHSNFLEKHITEITEIQRWAFLIEDTERYLKIQNALLKSSQPPKDICLLSTENLPEEILLQGIFPYLLEEDFEQLKKTNKYFCTKVTFFKNNLKQYLQSTRNKVNYCLLPHQPVIIDKSDEIIKLIFNDLDPKKHEVLDFTSPTSFEVKRLDKNGNYEFIQTLQCHQDVINSIVSVKDKLLTCSKDKTLAVFRIDKDAKYQLTQILIGHNAAVNEITSPSDDLIASASDDETIKIWRLNDTGLYQCTATLVGHQSPVNTLIAFQDGLLVSGSNDKRIIVWRLDKNKHQLLQTIIAHKDAVKTLVILQNDMFASSANDNSVKIWRLDHNKEFKCVQTLEVDPESTLDVLHSHKEALVSYTNQCLKLWEFDSLEAKLKPFINKTETEEKDCNKIPTAKM